jgi:hypothetical protein
VAAAAIAVKWRSGESDIRSGLVIKFATAGIDIGRYDITTFCKFGRAGRLGYRLLMIMMRSHFMVILMLFRGRTVRTVIIALKRHRTRQNCHVQPQHAKQASNASSQCAGSSSGL